MLTDEETREIQAEFVNYENRRAVCLDALRIVQQHRGWVDDLALRDVAALLGMTPAELDSVATFYNQIFRKPVGRHVIRVCDSVSCWLIGYDQLHQRLVQSLGVELGETTSDGQFTLLPAVCLGTCDHGPAMMVDGDLYRDLEDIDIDPVLAKYREGRP
ncbi:MAG: NADH-quinone oxidoreductase subunit NuoE [Anaerolineales bacterium]|jgi:NADH-quinone oxidoreductase subunit E